MGLYNKNLPRTFFLRGFKNHNKRSLYTRIASIFVLFCLLSGEASSVLAFSLDNNLGNISQNQNSPNAPQIDSGNQNNSESPILGNDSAPTGNGSGAIIPPTPPAPPTPPIPPPTPPPPGPGGGTTPPGPGGGGNPGSGSLCPGNPSCSSGSSGSGGFSPSSGSDPSYITVQPFGASSNTRPDIDLSTGALSYGFKINTPEGRGGLTPEISLKYNSQDYSDNSIVGFGWSLSIPSIYINTKYGVSGNFYTSSWNKFISSLSGELVSTSANNDKFRAKIDDGSFLDYSFDFPNKKWTVIDKSGKKYYFGLTSQSRQDNPLNSASVFKYMLEKIEDASGNSIDFYYFKDLSAIYPDKITYTNFASGTTTQNGIYEINFYREALTDYMTQYNSAFPISTQYRINKIQTKVLGKLISEYNLNYTNEINYIYTRSLLSSIAETHISDLGVPTVFPLTNFTYSSGPDDGSNASQRLPGIDFSKGVIISDINGDSYADVVKAACVKSSTGCNPDKKVWIYDPATDSYVENTNWVFPSYICQDDSNGNCQGVGYALFDISGDGLPDAVSAGYVNLNTGNGWSTPAIPTLLGSLQPTAGYRPIVGDTNGDSFPEVFTFTPSTGSNGFRSADYNRDGLLDLVQAYKWCCGGTGWSEGVYVNNGNGGFDFNQKATDNFPADKALPYFEDNSTPKGPGFFSISGNSFPTIIKKFGSVDVQNETASPSIQSGDFNGDGMMDTLKNDPVNLNNSQAINEDKFPDLLETISTREGGLINFEYKPSSDYKDSSGNLLNKIPFPVQTIKKIKEFDPINNLSSEKSYIYSGGYYSHDDSAYKPDSNGNYYYDKDQNYFVRKFEGFGKVEAINPDGGKTITYFHQQNGSDTSDMEENDDKSKYGKPYRTEFLDKNGIILSKSFTKWDLATTTALNGGAYFTYPSLSVSEEMDSSGGKRAKAVSMEYDLSSGNKIKEVNFGEVSINAEPFNFLDKGEDKISSEILYANFNSNSGTSGLPYQNISTDFNNKIISDSKITYDNLGLGIVEKGLLTKIEKLISGAKYQTNEIVYDSFGNPISKRDANGNPNSYFYDPYNLKPIQEINPKGFSRQYSYDYVVGKPKQVIDENNQIYNYVFDGVGRILEEKIPDPETGLQIIKTKYQYNDTPLQTSTTKNNYLDNLITVDSVTYFDGLGRKIQERSRAEDTASQNYSVKDYIYNSEGKLVSESLPYYAIGFLRSAPNTNQNLYQTYEYDGLNRTTKTTNSIGETKTEYKVGENTITDANDNQKTYEYDIRGNLTAVKEFLDGKTLTTKYFYNRLNNLIKIRDTKGSVREFSYDLLGRRTKAEDLHEANDLTFGVYKYKYDSLGNLIKETTPAGDEISYSYDSLNRVTKEDNKNTAGIETSYSYDSCVRGLGKLCNITSATSTSSYEYNFNDGMKKETKVIDGATTSVEYIYGRLNNLLSEKNLNLPEVTYEYNTAGLLENISYNASGIISQTIKNIDYSPSGQIAYQEYGNNDFERNTYDENSLYRLKIKEAKNISSSGAIINNFRHEYSYDKVGNITSILKNSYYDEDSSGATTTITIPALSNSGFIASGPETDLKWSTHHDAQDGYYINNNQPLDTVYVGSRLDGAQRSPILAIDRAFLVFDTSAIPSDATILSATTSITVTDYRNWNPTNESYINIYEGFNDPFSSLYLSDYSRCGDATTSPTELGIKKYISEITAPFATNFEFPIKLNDTGLSKIKKSKYTTLCLRDGHDAENIPITIAHDVPPGKDTGGSFVFFASQESTDPLIRPTLTITYVRNPNHPNSTVSNTTYSYDSLYRLTKEEIYSNSTSTKISSSYKYDEIGNILESSSNGTTTKFGYINSLSTINPLSNPHAIQLVGSKKIEYDPNGNITKDHKGIQNSWNYRNQLVSSNIPQSLGGESLSYTYDPAGSRVIIDSGKEKTIFFTPKYSRTLNKSNNTSLSQLHIFGGNSPVARLDIDSNGSTIVSYLHQDHLGSTILVTDSQGKKKESTSYDAFGNIISDKLISGEKERHKYTGHELDEDTGYTYAKARYLNTDTGRFASIDPMFWKLNKQLLVDPQQQNSYSYARNNPIIFTDPTGELNVVIPGTWAVDNFRNWQNDSVMTNYVNNVGAIFNKFNGGDTWVYDGPQINDNPKSREVAANYINNYIENYQFKEGETYNITAQSHGANVGAILSQKSNRRIDHLITLGAPVREDYRFNHSNIGQHINGFSTNDKIQTMGGTNISNSVIGIGSSLLTLTLTGCIPCGIAGLSLIGLGLNVEAGNAGRIINGAENINITNEANYKNYSTHSSTWAAPAVLDKISKNLR
ncbi:MAG: hypothetical protein EXS49_01190 [Candidatus Pacebacteria bacterium]|nr:hypothetical protein [Candidatus Paceibacterota bacterium]